MYIHLCVKDGWEQNHKYTGVHIYNEVFDYRVRIDALNKAVSTISANTKMI